MLPRLRPLLERDIRAAMATAPGESSAAILAKAPGVRSAPFATVELVQRRAFLDAELCRRLIALIEAKRRPSTLADPNGDASFRTSETCDLPEDAPETQAVEHLLHTWTQIDPAHGEPLQGQRYTVGQEFKPHTDYFEPGGRDYDTFCSVAGQRTWTVMVYLNRVEAGGGTRFTAIRRTFHPERGKALAWNNRCADASVNPDTIHHGMKVRQGTKYVITKWYREKPWGWQ